MPKGKEGKGTKVDLKTARKAIRMTPDGHRRLTLSNMGITIFPKCLFKLTNVDELDLSRNQIKTLPDSIGKLSSLRWLDLHSNKLESVPESIGNLDALTHLNLSNNYLTSAGLPSALGFLTCLRILNLGMNQLDTLPSTMVALDGLQELGLFDNRFVKLPECLNVLRNLTKVNMKRNPLKFAQGDVKEKPEPVDEIFLVHEGTLCRPCLKRCKHWKMFAGGGGGGGGDAGSGDMFEDKRIRTYTGLMVPKSVAVVNQDVWRIRETVK